MTPKTTPARRDRQWQNARITELLFTLVFALLFLLVARPPIQPVAYWALMVGGLVLGQLIWFWQYRALDERARLRFIKSWMVAGMITLNGLGLVLVWALFVWLGQPVAPGTGERIPLETLPMWPVYLTVVAGFFGMGLTNLYLRWKDGA